MKTSGIDRILTVVLFPIWLVVAALFTLPIYLAQQVLPSRTGHHAARYGHVLPGRPGLVACDVLAVLAAYVVGDVLRCVLYMKTAWPEVVPAYGSTVSEHLKMLAVVPLAWPLILTWLGWYKDRWRSARWKAVNTLAASVLLGLVMAAFALLVARDIYPRVQIGFTIVLLPLATALSRAPAILYVRTRQNPEAPPAADAD